MKALKHEAEGDNAVAEDGLVLLDGPNGVAVAMSERAARETARALLAAADAAAKQAPPLPD